MSSNPPTRRSGVAALLVAALALAACGPSTPELTDPAEILQAGASSLGEMETVHLRGTVDGELPLDLGGLGGGGGGVPLPVDGTTFEADLDLGRGALAFELLAPTLFNFRLDLRVVDGTGYLRAPLVTGSSWVRQPAAGGIGGDPGAALDGLATFLARPELRPEKLPDVRCLGTDCYSVRFAIAGAAIRDALGGFGEAIPGLGADDVGEVTVTVGVRKDDRRLATLALEIPVGDGEPLAIALELSRVDEPVTIEAPPADEVTDTPGG